jgi:serine/threonine-protein kinase HipA
MTPLYDVLTVQPTYDQGQIQRNDFKLAMRFGKSNHYKIENIHGRHIVETGVQGGLSKDAIGNLFEELHQDAPKAIEKTIKELPNGFPAALIESVQGAISDRLKRLD